MIYLEIVGTPMLIVNSHDVAVDLLSKRSANYSSRPQLVIQSLSVPYSLVENMGCSHFAKEWLGVGYVHDPLRRIIAEATSHIS